MKKIPFPSSGGSYRWDGAQLSLEPATANVIASGAPSQASKPPASADERAAPPAPANQRPQRSGRNTEN